MGCYLENTMKNQEYLMNCIQRLEEKVNMMNKAHLSICDEIIVYITELEEKLEKLDATSVKKDVFPKSKICKLNQFEEYSMNF